MFDCWMWIYNKKWTHINVDCINVISAIVGVLSNQIWPGSLS